MIIGICTLVLFLAIIGASIWMEIKSPRVLTPRQIFRFTKTTGCVGCGSETNPIATEASMRIMLPDGVDLPASVKICETCVANA